MNFITEIDFDILNAIQSIRCGFLDLIMPLITKLGNGGILWIISGVVLCMIRKYRKCGFCMLISMLIGFIIGNLILKNMAVRERPCWIIENVSMLISIPALILAVIIAFSRVYLFVHFPSDILAGAILGAAIGIFVPKLSERIFGQKTSVISDKKQ